MQPLISNWIPNTAGKKITYAAYFFVYYKLILFYHLELPAQVYSAISCSARR